jgi:small-conductance mechanosensitive channel
MDIQQAINLSIFRQFKEKGIQFAYPTQTLLIEKDPSPAVDFPAVKTEVGAQRSTV